MSEISVVCLKNVSFEEKFASFHLIIFQNFSKGKWRSDPEGIVTENA